MKTFKIFILVSLFFGFTSVFSQQTVTNNIKGDSKAVKENVDVEKWPDDQPPPNFIPKKKNREVVSESQVVNLKNHENQDTEELSDDRPPPNWVPPVKKQTSKSLTSDKESDFSVIDETTGIEIQNPTSPNENNKDPKKLN